MPALKNKIYFNYGGQGPLPQPSLEAITSSWEKIQEIGPFTNTVWPYIAKEIEDTKKELSEICGVPRKRIALTENVTSGCVLPLWGLPFNSGDRILISDCEHPGVIAACREIARRESLKIDILKVRQLREGVKNPEETHNNFLKILDNSLKNKTKLVVLSHILWNTGQLMPIKAVADRLKEHKEHPYLLVDAAQSFGQIPIKEACINADIYAFTGHKWALGPEGLGGVSLSERLISDSKPTLIGWRSLHKEIGIYANISNPFHIDSRKFEIATSCIPLLSGLRCSLNLLKAEGSEFNRIERIKELSSSLWEGLSQLKNIKTVLKSPPPSGLISFSISNQCTENSIVKKLGEQKLWIRVLEDPNWLRACVHITTTKEEILLLLKAIEEIQS